MLVFLMVIFVQPMGSQRIFYDLYKTLGILCCFLINNYYMLSSEEISLNCSL